jgi:hypothetical protein
MVAEAISAVASPSGIPRVRFGSPDGDAKDVGCTVFLYRVSPDAFRRNDDLPTRDDGGTVLTRPATVIAAEYLLLFSGDESTLEPQRFLGATVAALARRPFLPADAVSRAIASAPYLATADFTYAPERLRLTPTPLDLTALTQLWSSFARGAYRVSLCYTISGIAIDAGVDATPPPPPREVVPTVGPSS